MRVVFRVFVYLVICVVFCCFAEKQCLAKSGRIITDMAGRQVVLPKRVKRIVTTFKPATLCVFCLGLTKYLVGVDTDSTRDPFDVALYPQITKVTRVGSKSQGLNFETIVSLKPDVVIIYAQKDGLQIADRLSELNIAVIVILPETINTLKQCLRLVAQLVDEPERAEKVIQAMDDVLKLVRDKVNHIPAGKRKTVYYASPRGFFSTASGELLQDKMISMAGGINVGHGLKGYFQDISPEQLIFWNPDIIVVSRNILASTRKILSRPEFYGIKAVSNKETYCFPSNIAPWDFPSPLSCLGVLWLGTRLYPDLFSDMDLNQKVDEFHKLLFKKTLSDLKGQIADNVFP